MKGWKRPGGGNQFRGHPFRARSWADIRAELAGMATRHSSFQYLVDVIDSVTGCGADQFLAANTSMHDLMVRPHPVDGQVDFIIIRAPSSINHPAAGQVRIEHRSSTGRDDSIDRPTSEAVPLFWRFAFEKYGIEPPNRSG